MSIRTLDIAEATQSLAEYAQQVDTGPIVITSRGRPVAVVAAIENGDLTEISQIANLETMVSIDQRCITEQKAGSSANELLGHILGLDMSSRCED